jgi:hypothetical protein
MDRSEFFGRQLRYLFSFGAPLEAGRKLVLDRQRGWCREAPDRRRVPLDPQDGCASQVHRFDGAHAGDGPPARVYDAHGDEREESVRGTLAFLQERVAYPAGDEHGELFGRLVIDTEDRQLIEATYTGTLQAGDEWHWIARRPPSPWGADEPFARVRTKAFIATRFETPSTKYRWLVSLECIGYGLVDVVAGQPLAMTFDIYALGMRSAAKDRQSVVSGQRSASR